MTMPIGGNAGAMLRSFVERVERINEEIKASQEDRKEVFAEAKGAGFDVKVIKEVIRMRAKDQDELDEFEALVQTYWGALKSAPGAAS